MSGMTMQRALGLVLIVACAGPWLSQAAGQMSLDQLKAMRKQLAQRKRRIMFNNDGCDALYFPKDEKVTRESFLAKRSTPLVGTQVDAIAYCSTSSGFSNFTHRTRAGTIFTRSGVDFGIAPTKRNIAQDLIDQGTDTLQAVVEFAHQHQIEAFWSIRMNDTHDAAHHPDKPYFLFPKLKYDHPDWLVGNPVKRSPYGRWSSVDYALPQIRDLAFEFIAEVCRDYDVDGVELDYFRHLCYFKSTAFGGKASDEERAMVTDLMRRVRHMTEEEGMKRGRPILVAIRVPDSVEFDRDMGLDVEQWLAEGLVDMLITTCYFRLNPWQYTVDLAHKYGVMAYPCLSDSRVRGSTRFKRGSSEAYRGRAMNAWLAGADGIHMFNHFKPRAAIYRELGDPEKLRTMKKLYFVTVRDGLSTRFLAGGERYRTIPMLGPGCPVGVTAKSPLSVDITIGDDVAAAEQAGEKPKVVCHLNMPIVKRAEELAVKFNGSTLTHGEASKGWVDYPVPPACVEQGTNRIEVAVAAGATRSESEWGLTYDGAAKPKRPWLRDRGSKRTVEKLTDGALFLADRGTVSGDYLYYRYRWGAEQGGETAVEARVKVVSGSSFIIFCDGVAHERLGLWPDRIELWTKKSMCYKMDTTQDFHVYRIETKGKDLKVYVDGELRIDCPGLFSRPFRGARNELGFGAANSGMVGEALWDYVKVRPTNYSCDDLVVSVAYGKK